MKQYATEKIRNLVLLGHGGTGKTSLAEAALFVSGAINRLGKVEDGTTTSDFDPDEIKRKVSISASLAPVEWKDHKLNIIDTPGYADFLGEAYSGLAAADAAVIVVCAASGVQVGTEQTWEMAAGRHIPRAVVINRIDRENADFAEALRQIQSELSKRAVAVEVPIGAVESFQGVVDLIDRKAYLGDKATPGDVPADMADTVETLRSALAEAVAENDEELLDKFLEGNDLTPEEIRKGLALGIASGDLYPVFTVSSTRTTGIARLLDAIVEYFPTPADHPIKAMVGEKETELKADPNGPLAVQAFKTTADPYVGKLSYLRVYSGTLKSDSHVWDANKGVDERTGHLFIVRGKHEEPVPELVAGDIGAVAKLAETLTGNTLTTKEQPVTQPPIVFPEPVFIVAQFPHSKADTEKMSAALARIVEEDPVLQVHRDLDTGETILAGLGESHVESACEKMKRKFGADVVHETPRVPYKETVTSKISSEHTHKKQSGGHGQYAKVTIEIEPLPRGSGFEFVNKTVGGSVPKQYVPAVEHGVQEALHQGVLSHNEVVDVRVSLTDGKEHPVDSSEMAFKLAGSQALKEGVEKARPVLLEPIVNVRVKAPETFTGDLVSDLNGKRAHVLGITPEDHGTVIDAQAPLAEMQRYATDLRSLTQGRATFSIVFDHYAEVPDHVAKKVIEAAQKAVPAGEHH
jgi:elongation factor G